jgi:CarD family transcriptional regulator, regulator of rRNA transcription
MAQKMAPTKVGSKKSAKKAPERKAHRAAPVKSSAKAKPKAAPVKAQAKHAAKATPARPHAQKATVHAAAKAPAHPVPPSHKAPAKAPVKAHAAPKHETVKPAVAPGKVVTAKAPIMPPPARPAAASAARAMPAAVAKTASQKIIAPAAPPSAHPPTQKPSPVPQPAAAAQAAAASAAAAAAAAAKKPVHQRHGFKVNEWIVYPAHGVGRIVAIEEQEIAGISLELFVITFEKDKMTLRVPTGKSESVGMRKLAEEPTVKKAIETLKGRARVKRTMWSRRAQEYEAKINSGDLISIAEVVRDLYRSESQPEQSYSERQLYEAALDRMAREIAVVEKLDERGAVQRITEVLAKSARGRNVAAEAA